MESEANAPEDGRILNRVYENKYFGFSIRLPAGWCITDRASFVALQLRKREQPVRQAKPKEDAAAFRTKSRALLANRTTK
jgi:hypothetical protein